MKSIGTIGGGFPGMIILEDGEDGDGEFLDELNRQLHCAIDDARSRERFIENEEKGYVVGSCWMTNGKDPVQYQKITYINEDGSPNAITITKNSNGSMEINMDTYLFTRWNTPIKISKGKWDAVVQDLKNILTRVDDE